MIKLYIASPFGFSEAGKFFMYERLIPRIEAAGFEILDPWRLTDEDEVSRVTGIVDCSERKAAWESLNKIIGKNNEKAILESDAIVAVLDGSDIDSGTASEIGYAAALGKTVIGYRSDFRKSGDNEGSTVNLQVEFFIFKNNGKIVNSLDDLESQLKNFWKQR